MKKKESPKEFSRSYIKNIFRIIFISGIIISFAVIATAFLGYINIKNSLIAKAKSQDIVFMVKSMASKIDGRISRAVETSYIFARDPLNVEWVNGEEKDQKVGKLVLSNLESIATSYDYNYFFIAGVKTKNYYFRQSLNKNDKNFIVLSENNPEDRWFFETLKSKKQMSFNVNYDRVMDDTFLFVNTIMGSVENPVGITGVALSLNNITKEFKEFKVGKKSNLWMVDEKGVIKLSDKEKM
ncbi:cache domain-containing protein [Clostridium ljungdahlii]|uniref:cache domain-containing protein n=1 Tax=Clostridium ljungdahlii TaxID=1538 RepID=UPI00386488D8